MSSASTNAGAAKPHLRRSIGLWDLIFYGIVLIQPTAPMPIYGVISKEARGHVVTTILIAMCAMLFTAISYGRMARAYPSAGSAYTYVGREIHSGLGFVTGWSMAMDYMINPFICIVWCAKAAMNVAPDIPYLAWVTLFAVMFTLLNLQGIRTTARTNQGLLIGMSIVIVYFFIAVVRYIMHMAAIPPGFYTHPFYNPATFSWNSISTGTSIAVLTYIGFDGISTLSEEVQNPRRNILLATVLTCLITGVLATCEVYAAQLVWPDYTSYPDVDTAFVHVAGRAGGVVLLQVVNATLLVATIGSGMGAQLAAARLLYGMGRDNTIPRGFFAFISPKNGVPRNNVLFIGTLALIAAVMPGAAERGYQFGAELLNFGAFIAFMGVNAAAFVRYYLREDEKRWSNFLPPVLGFVICLYIWLSLRTPAKIAGSIWLVVGIAYAAYKTNGFRRAIQFSDPPPE